MAVSKDTEHRNSKTFWERAFGQLTRYDLVLTVIPLAFVLAAVVAVILSVPLPAALAAGAILSTIGLADALFFNPPVEAGSEL